MMSSSAFSSLIAHLGDYTNWIVPFLFTLTIIVFFHELGHFLVARWCGIRVLVFSMGFGPEVAGFNDRHGTRWKISLIPLGGYVKFFGDDNEASVPDPAVLAAMSEEERKHSFFGQSVGRRAAVVVAGPLTNFILAIVVFAGVFMVFGKPTAIPRVATVEPNSAAAAAGFQPGDLVTAIDGRAIDNFVDMQRIVGFSGGHPLTIVVDRGGIPITLNATPEIKNNRGILGVTRSNQPGDVKVESVGALDAVKLGADKTWFIVETTLSYIRDVFVGRPDRRPDRDRPDLGAGRGVGMGRAVRLYRRDFRLHRPVEPVSGSAARWGAPFVLFHRGDSRAAPVGTRSGGRISDRPCNRRNVDDFCHGERHSASARVVICNLGATL
jgi:regulator of sigma E protease